MRIQRRDFLTSLGAVSISAALPMPVQADTWDVTWIDRLKGSHRAIFDSPAFSEGEALYRAVFWSRNYKEVYGTPAQDMSGVLVIRAEGIWLAMNDAYWK